METLKSLEATGKTPEEAIAKGLAQLGLDSDDVIIEVLSKSGADARVRLTPFPTGAAQPVSGKSSGGTHANADPAGVAQDVLDHLLHGMGLRATIEVGKGTLSEDELTDENGEPAEPPIILNITGNDLTLLIGRKGETLTALQMMTRLITSHKVGRNVGIVVDVEHYKERREESLRNLALRLAEQVQVKGRTVALEPMPPNERRIIHIALRDHEGVTTLSVGIGDARKVTIIPKKQGAIREQP
jgi:spoIIIJ-associated protein